MKMFSSETLHSLTPFCVCVYYFLALLFNVRRVE